MTLQRDPNLGTTVPFLALPVTELTLQSIYVVLQSQINDVQGAPLDVPQRGALVQAKN